MTRVCEYCAKPLEQNVSEENRHFRVRRFCDRVCSTTATRVELPIRQCVRCGQDIARVRNGRRDRPHEYSRRLLCRHNCNGTPTATFPPLEVVREEYAHFAGYGMTPDQVAEKLQVPTWYVEQAVAS